MVRGISTGELNSATPGPSFNSFCPRTTIGKAARQTAGRKPKNLFCFIFPPRAEDSSCATSCTLDAWAGREPAGKHLPRLEIQTTVVCFGFVAVLSVRVRAPPHSGRHPSVGPCRRHFSLRHRARSLRNPGNHELQVTQRGRSEQQRPFPNVRVPMIQRREPGVKRELSKSGGGGNRPSSAATPRSDRLADLAPAVGNRTIDNGTALATAHGKRTECEPSFHLNAPRGSAVRGALRASGSRWRRPRAPRGRSCSAPREGCTSPALRASA